MKEEVDYSDFDRMVEENSEDALITAYFADVQGFRLLKKREEAALGSLIQEYDDLDARNKLVEHNLRLAVWVGRRYRNRGLAFLDVVQEGNLGLLIAADRFDPAQGNRFSTYATWWVRQGVTRAIADFGQTIRIPVHKIEFWNKIRRVSATLVQTLGREPKAEEIAEAILATYDSSNGSDLPKNLKTLTEDVKTTLRQMQMATTMYFDDLEQKLGFEKGDESLEENMPDLGSLSPEQIILAQETYQNLKLQLNGLLEVVATFSEREHDMIVKRYGLNDLVPMTLDEIGQLYDVTRERVRQIVMKVWTKLNALGINKDEMWLQSLMYRLRLVQDLTGQDVVSEEPQKSQPALVLVEQPKGLFPGDVIRATCTFYDVSRSDITSDSQNEKVLKARWMTMYLLRKDLGKTFEEVAVVLRRGGDAGAKLGYAKIEEGLKQDHSLSEEIQTIRELCLKLKV